MIGIILLIVAIFLYFNPKYRYISYIIYIGFMSGSYGGYNLYTDNILGVNNTDLAIIYTFIISVYLINNHKFKLPKASFIRYYKLLTIFLFCSVFFSYLYYKFTFYQILQGGRELLLLFSLVVFINIKSWEFTKIIRILYYITLYTSVLYILQVVIGKPLMPYPIEVGIDETTGLVRFYNSPPLMPFYLVLTFIFPEYFGKRLILARCVFFTALICTQGRTGIFSAIIAILLSIYFLGKASKTIKTIIILSILIFPFYNVILDRFQKGNTANDIAVISNGGFKDYETTGGTMTFRIAWFYERFEYLINRPIGEQLFGLGLISDSQPIVNKMYNFKIGLTNEETGLPVQLSTADIAYGNILTQLGFLGGFIYILFIISMAVYFYKHRNVNYFVLITASQIIVSFLTSFSGSTISNPKNLTFFFVIFVSILNSKKVSYIKNNNHENCTY